MKHETAGVDYLGDLGEVDDFRDIVQIIAGKAGHVGPSAS
jgi:hypothetical protein